MESDEPGEVLFVAAQSSPWDNDDLRGPFGVVSFLCYATFSYWDEGDTWETQWDQHSKDVQHAANEYFRGPRASLLALLNAALSSDIRHLADRLNVCAIKVNRNEPGERSWTVELTGAGDQPL